MLKNAITEIAAKPETFTGYCFRCVSPRYSHQDDIFSGKGSRHTSGRYHRMFAFSIVYTACSPELALWESTNTARSGGIQVAKLLPMVLVGAEVNMSVVLNLTDATVRRTLKVTKRSIVDCSWSTATNETLTQLIGRIAFECGFEAILAPSAGPGINLNIIRDNIRPTSRLIILNPDKLPRP